MVVLGGMERRRLREGETEAMGKNRVITIGRQLGSGGSYIGREVARRLGIECYDKRLIELACKYGNVDLERMKDAEEKRANPFLFSVPREVQNDRTGHGGSINDMVFNLQSAVIRQLAERESCIIVGRCADYVLREQEDVRSVFIFSDLGSRIERVSEKHRVLRDQALNLIRKEDKARRNYYECYAGKRWGSTESYDVSLNSGRLGLNGCVEMICALYNQMEMK